MSILQSVKSSFLSLKGQTPAGYEGERKLLSISDNIILPAARKFPSIDPNVTPAIEMLTEVGELMLTEDNFNIITE